MTPHRSAREVASGSAITLLGLGLHFALQYGLWVLVSRFWGAEGLGLFVTGVTVLWVGGGIFRLGLSQGTLRYVAVLKGLDRQRAIRPLLLDVGRVVIVSSLAGALLLFALAGPLGGLFRKPDLVPLIRVLAVGVVLWNIVFVAFFAVQGLRKMHWMVAIRDIAQPGFALVLVAAAGLLGFTLVGGSVAYVLSLVPALGFALFAVFRLVGRGQPEEPPPLREVLFFSFPLIWTQLVSYGVRQQEILVTAYFLPAADVGLYGAALRTAAMVGFALQATNSAFAPLLAHLHGTGELDELRQLYRTVSRWCFTVALPLFLACAVFGREMLELWGAEFAPAWGALVLLAAAQLVNVSTGAAGSVLIMGERQKIELSNSVLALVLGLALDVLLIPRYGIVGAAVGAGLAMVAVNLLRVAQVYRLWRANPFSIHYSKPLAAGVAAAAAGLGVSLWTPGLGLPPAAVLVLGLPILTLVYLAGLWLAGIPREDVEVARVRRRRAGRPRLSRAILAGSEAAEERAAPTFRP